MKRGHDIELNGIRKKEKWFLVMIVESMSQFGYKYYYCFDYYVLIIIDVIIFDFDEFRN